MLIYPHILVIGTQLKYVWNYSFIQF